MNKNVILVKYHEDFADNMSCYALAKIIENQTGEKICYENKPTLRNNFEKYMSSFDMKYNFISSTRIKEIAKKAYEFNSYNKKNLKNKSKLIKNKSFKLENIQYLNSEIINNFQFKSSDFIVNHDILEEINTQNSIGLFIDENDIKENLINYNFILEAAKRLNKYVKRPKLYIFTKKNLNGLKDILIDYKIITIDDWREEFYFLKSCKHKIILNSKYSYSKNFWASILNQKNYYYTIYDKKLKTKKLPNNWIGI